MNHGNGAQIPGVQRGTRIIAPPAFKGGGFKGGHPQTLSQPKMFEQAFEGAALWAGFMKFSSPRANFTEAERLVSDSSAENLPVHPV